MIHVILSLIIHTYVLRFARPSLHSTHSICSCLACSCARRAASLPSLRDAVQSHSGSDPYYSPLRLETHGSIHDGRSIIRVQPLPLATATMPLPSHHHRPTSAHPSIYAAQYSTPRTPTLASIIAPPLRTTLRYATLHSSHGTSPLRTTTLRAPPSSFLHFHGSSILA
jgi:hypothetical protein